MGNNGAVEIGGHHDIELCWIFDKLHRTVINDHLLVLQKRVFLGCLSGALEEKAINQLHDVGLVDYCDFLAATQMCELEGILYQPFRVVLCGDFERLHYSRVNLVLDSREFTFGVLSYHCKINIVVSVGY